MALQVEIEGRDERRRRLLREATARYRARKRGATIPLRNTGPVMEPLQKACIACGDELTPKTGNGGGHPKRFCSKKCKAKFHNRNPDRRWSYVESTYGLSREDHDALLRSQDGRCAICQSDDPKSPNWHVDHDHLTGAVRGLLCLSCNSGIGQLRDDPEVLRRAAEYIEKAR